MAAAFRSVSLKDEEIVVPSVFERFVMASMGLENSYENRDQQITAQGYNPLP